MPGSVTCNVCSVVLTEVGPSKNKVIKAVLAQRGAGLRETMDMVKSDQIVWLTG